MKTTHKLLPIAEIEKRWVKKLGKLPGKTLLMTERRVHKKYLGRNEAMQWRRENGYLEEAVVLEKVCGNSSQWLVCLKRSAS